MTQAGSTGSTGEYGNFAFSPLGHIQVSMDVLLLGKLTLITTPADYYRRSLISPPLHFREGLLLQHVKEETPPIMHT